jgi:hypothetical protein
VPLHVVERRGCDTEPVDPTTEEGRLRLTSYVWPDQLERLERLRGALQIASQVPAPVLRQSARDFVGDLQLAPGTTTVVWHSIMWQYLDDQERSDVEARLEQLGDSADADARLAHLALEPRRRTPSSDHEVLECCGCGRTARSASSAARRHTASPSSGTSRPRDYSSAGR